MMGKIKRVLFIVSLMITVEFAMSTPIKSEAASSVTLTQLKQKFPAGKYWNHAGQSNNNPDGYTSVPCTHHGNCSKNGYSGWCGCNSFGSSIQCFGFANKLAYDAFGSLYTSWGRTNLNNLKAGDVIRYKNDGHSIFVTGISGDTITYGDCNSDGHCIIRWDAKISKSTVAKTLTAVYSAPAELSVNSENDSFVDLGSEFYANIEHQSTGMYLTDQKNNIAGEVKNGSKNQIWKFVKLSNGAYRIQSALDGSCMEVYGCFDEDGTNVYTWPSYTGGTNQQFYIYHKYDAYYFRPAHSQNKMLDMSLTDFNVALWVAGNDWEPQEFNILKIGYVDDKIEADPVNLGSEFYANIEHQSTGVYLTNQKNNIAGEVKNGSKSQIWKFERLSSGAYKIKSALDDSYMDVYGCYDENGTNIYTWPSYTGEINQQFFIYYMYGAYYFRPANTYNKMLDISSADYNVALWIAGNDWEPQEFNILKIDYVDDKIEADPVDLGSAFYANIEHQSTGVYLTNQKNNIAGEVKNGSKSQIWKFERLSSGAYKIKSALDDSYMDVYGCYDENGTNIYTWPSYTGEINQQFFIYYMYDAYYFRPANTYNKMLDISSENYNVALWIAGNDWEPQEFNINKINYVLISECNVEMKALNYIYDGSPKTPSVTVKNGTITLVEGTDYTIAYSNNTNAGTATATITGTGSYTGTISRNFTINKANQTINASISASTIQEGATAQVTAGGEGTKTYTSSNPSVATVDASGLVTGRTAGTAVITVTAEETGNYFSATATVPVTVTHAYGSGTVTTEATCTQDGVRTYTCSGCGKTYTEAIRAKGHSYAESVTGATCTERGYTTHTCSACGDSYRNLYVDALGHQFDQGVVTKAPTGDTDGIRTYTCSRCRITREETIPATGHTYDNGTVTKEATCTEAGIRTYRCSDCGRTYTEEIPSLGHRYETAVTAPSCTKKGYTTHTCAVCGDSYKDSYTDAAGHSYNDGEVAEEAACTEEGLKIYTCVNCRNQYTELIPASGHQYEERVTAPSCTKKGYTTHTCTVCRYSYKDDYTNALGHSYDEGEIVEEPTCTEEGLQRYTCLRCQNQYTETIAAAGHQYVSIVTEPGCTEKGYTTHTCTACGESYQDSYVNATGHDYDEGEVVEEPTCTEEGLQRYTCLRCRNQYTETIAASGHRWDNGEIITAATASSTGRKMYICGECGEKKIETIPALSDEKEQKPSNPETNTPPQENQTERHLTAGETVSVGSSCYRVTASGKTVEYAGCLMDGITFIGIPKKVVLHGVTYPVTGIADRAFAKNQKLMTVLIPEGVRVIGDAAFENCKSLKKVTIPSSVEKIGKRAFYGCRRLANLTIKTKKLTKKKVGEKAFTKAGSASYKKLKVKVPKVKRKAYQGLLKKKGLSPKAKMK